MQPDTPPTRGGNRGVRIAVGIVLALLVVVLLFQVVFPWFQEYQDDPTLEGAAVPTVAVVRL